MTVCELIDELKCAPSDAEVEIDIEDSHGDVEEGVAIKMVACDKRTFSIRVIKPA